MLLRKTQSCLELREQREWSDSLSKINILRKQKYFIREIHEG